MSKHDLDSATLAQHRSVAHLRNRSSLMLSAAMLALSAAPAWAEPSPPTALPTGGTIAAGSATLSTSGTDLTVNQSSNRVVIDWRSFNIGSAAGVTFNQPSSRSIAVNRVSGGGAPSQIDGRLTANGIVAVLNPNGVLFGGNARVDVGGLVASTGQIDANAFMGGNDRLAFSGASDGEIVVQAGARLNIADAGLAAFVAPRVRNDGVITARGGRIALGAGETFTLDLAGDRLLELGVAADSPLVQNHGQLLAAGGQVQLSARAAGALVDQIINVGGLVSVASAHSDGGTIVLDGVGGSASIGGTLDASGTSGGTIKAIADSLAVAGNAVLRANASGTGNGGFIETSGTKSITVADGVSVSAAAAGGKAGTWLIDPTNITITSGSGGGLGGSTVTTGAVEAALGGGTNVTITTDLAGTEDGDLTVAGSINATSSGNAGLTLTGRRISRTGGSTINIAGGALTLNVNAVNPVTSTAGLGNWIQDALDTIGTVSGGSTVNIGAGTYIGNVLISRSNVSLVSSAGRDATTIQGVSGTGALGAVQIGANANNTLVEGFTILGIDSPSPGIENAAVYFQGANSGSTIRNNRITAAGDAGLQNEFGQAVSNLTVTGNIFNGQTYAGAAPATGNQFTVPNVSRQLVVLSGGSGGGATSAITFTNNQVTGDSGLNTAVTIDSVGATITGNSFASLTGGFGAGLRARGTDTLISGNIFDNSRLAIGTSPLTVRTSIYGSTQTNFAAVLAANTFSGGGAWSTTTLSSMDTLFRSIQNAVLTSASGATVTVLPGTYNENVLITLPNITLVSSGGRDVTTIQGISGTSALGAVQIAANANNTVVDGFTILGIDSPNPGIENAAVYFQGANSGSTIRNNRITAAGDAGLQNEFGQAVSNLTVTGNIFNGQTYAGATPATGNQFTVPNVSRQLVVLSGGSGGGATSAITFTNNQVTGDSGFNTAVTIDSVGATITGNSFASLTGSFGAGLRARGTDTLISGNIFDNSRLAIGTSPLTVRTSIYGSTQANFAAVLAANTFSGGGAWTTTTLNSMDTLFRSIQNAVLTSASGATVTVLPGTYNENVLITLPNITLVSSGGRDVTTIQGISGTSALGAVQIAANANNTVVDGFTIIGIDSPNPGIENAAVYFQGANSGSTIRNNRITAAGDAGLQNEFGQAVSNLTVTGNIFNGQTYAGAAPATGNQFTVPNVSRQLVVLSGGSGGGATSAITFTNNQVTGDSGLNTAVTIDSVGATITGNSFASLTGGFGAGLRARGTDTLISGNIFDNSRLAIGTSPLTVRTSIYGSTQANFAAVLAANTFSGGGAWTTTTLNSMDTLFRSIQNAVLASTSGATVTVLPGTYNENVLVSAANISLVFNAVTVTGLTLDSGATGSSVQGMLTATTGGISAANPLLLSGDTTLTAQGSAIALANVDGAANLALTGDSITIGAAGATTALTSLTATGATISTAGAVTTGTQSYNGGTTVSGTFTSGSNITITGSTTLGGTTAITSTGGNVSIGSVDGAQALTVTGNGVTLGSVGATTALTSLTATGTSITTAGAITTGAQTFTGATTLAGTYTGGGNVTVVGATTLGGATSLTSSGGNVALGTVNGAQALTVTGTGVTIGTVGASSALTSLAATGGTIVTAGATTTGGQSFTGATTLAGSYTGGGSISVSGASTLGGGTTLTSTGGTVTLGTVNGAQALALTGTGVTIGAVGGATALSSLAATGGTIATAGAATTGAQSFTGATTLAGSYTGGGNISVVGATTLGAATNVTSTGGTVTIGTVNGAQALVLNGTGVTIGAVGGTTALTSLAATGATIVTAGAITTGAQNFTGATTLAGSYTTNGGFTVAGAGTLGSTTTITTNGGALTLGSVTGPSALTLTAGTGNVTVGAATVASITAQGAAITTAGATTTGAQSYTGATTLAGTYSSGGAFSVTGATTLAGATAVSNTSGNVVLGTVNGAQTLAVNSAGTATIGAVGATQALTALTVTGASINTSGATTSGAQSYTGPISLNGSYTSGGFTTTGAATLAGATTINAGTGGASLAAINGTSAGAQGLTLTAGTASLGAAGALIRLGGVLITANQVVLNGNAYAANTLAFLASGANATVRVTQPITTFSTVQTGPAGNIQITPTLIGTANNAQNLVFNAGTGLSAANDGDITLGNVGSAALRLGSLTLAGRNFTAQTVRLGGDFVSSLSGNQLFSAQTLDTLGAVTARVAGNDTGPIIAGGAVTITSGGGGGGSVQAGGPVTLSYASNVTRAVTSTGPVSVTSTAGSISGPISSGGAVTLATPQGNVSSTITASGTVGISSSGPVTSTVTTPSTITISSSQPVNVQLNGGTVTVNAPGGTVSGVFGQIVTTSTGTFLVNEQPVLGSGTAEARQIIRDSFLAPAGGTVGSSGEIQLPVGLAIALIAPAGEGKGKRPSIIVNNVNGLGELLRLGYTAIIIDIDQSGLAIEQELTGDNAAAN